MTNLLRNLVIDNGLDTDDVVKLLEITVEDLLDRFEDRLNEHSDKLLPDGYSDLALDNYDGQD